MYSPVQHLRPASAPARSTRRTITRRVAVAVVASLVAGLTACASPSAPGGSAPSTTGRDPASAPASTVAPVTQPPGTVPADPAVEVPAPPAFAPFEGDADARAAAYVSALADGSADRDATVLAGFAAAELPVVAADGTSLTTPDWDGLAGLPWGVVWSTSGRDQPDGRVGLAEAAEMLALIDPVDVDARTVADQLLDGLRAARAGDAGGGTAFLAGVVARYAAEDGLDLADPAVTADQVQVSHPVVTLLFAGFLHAALSTLQSDVPIADDASAGAATSAVSASAVSGWRSASPQRPALLPGSAPLDGCNGDDGMNGWLLWIVSKVMTGAAMPGLPQWGGMYEALVSAAVQRGYLIPQALELTSAMGKGAGIAGAVVNVLLFAAQAAGTKAIVSMNGDGPLVRTKTSSHGEARTVTIHISTTAGVDGDEIAKQNCMLAIASLFGNNALRAFGDAANVQVEVSGGAGFANSLAAGNSLVLFGPAEFQPIQTADANGIVTVPVQGRAQRRPVPETARPVDKQFSIIVEASLDPVDATTIGKQFLDSSLCAGSFLGGASGGDVATACVDSVVNTIKQFHWDLGEYSLPLTDWEHGWVIDETIAAGGYPFTITGVSCFGPYGPWDLAFYATPPGLTMTGNLSVVFDVVDDVTGTGEVQLDWHAESEQGFADSAGTVQATLTYEGGERWMVRFVPGSYATTVVTPVGALDVGNSLDTFELPVRPATEGECGADG